MGIFLRRDIQQDDTQHKGVIMTFSINNTQHYGIEYHYAECRVFCYAACHSAECRYAKCRGAGILTVEYFFVASAWADKAKVFHHTGLKKLRRENTLAFWAYL